MHPKAIINYVFYLVQQERPTVANLYYELEKIGLTDKEEIEKILDEAGVVPCPEQVGSQIVHFAKIGR